MRVLDRLTGKETNAPEALVPGRYCALKALTLNGHSQFAPGQPILDDGTGAFRGGDGQRAFVRLDLSDEQAANVELTEDAIHTIVEKAAWEPATSPMLPAELVAHCGVERIEEMLSVTLGEGHLQTISERPRLDLRYDETIVPVGRARRMAADALTHLAAHSECWQRRTLTGVQPRKVMARFSEDDYALYENRLYARLLDMLERHLVRRIAKVRGLRFRLEAAQEFHDSERTHHRLRTRICQLWGATFQSDGDESLDTSHGTLDVLTAQLRSVRSLKQRGLYTMVPRAAQVGGQIHRTNILNHDPHYRHLPPLWEELRSERLESRRRPEENVTRAVKLQQAYSDYVGVVLRHSVEQHSPVMIPQGFRFNWSGGKVLARRDGADWLLEADDVPPLRFVPIFWFGDLSCELIGDRRIVCTPEAPPETSAWRLAVSPMDLYVVERMGRVVDGWLMQGPAQRYGQALGPIPSFVATTISGWPEITAVAPGPGRAEPPRVRLRSALPREKITAFMATLRAHANRDVQSAFEVAIRDADILGRCPSCGAEGYIKAMEPAELHGECRSCGTRWGIGSADGDRRLSRTPGSAPEGIDPFHWAGREWNEMCLTVEAR